jgi:RNA polymerase sigma-70 factor (ECF subfamily)
MSAPIAQAPPKDRWFGADRRNVTEIEESRVDEEDLIRGAKAHDDAAYSRLMKANEEVAFRLAYQVTGDEAEAADAVQEGFIRAYRALGRFRDGAPFRPWLLRIVFNEARQRRRSRGRFAALLSRVGAIPAAAEPDPIFTVLATETRDEVALAVAALSEPDRQLIHMRYFLDLDESAMATVLGVPRGTVKSRLWRARAHLRTQLVETGQWNR